MAYIKKRGWRTYAACIALILIGVASGLGYYVPDWLVTVIAGLGGIAGRAAITNNAKKTTEDAEKLFRSVMAGNKKDA